jgi:hypothetical protein
VIIRLDRRNAGKSMKNGVTFLLVTPELSINASSAKTPAPQKSFKNSS